LAQCFCCGIVCHPSDQCGICGLDSGTQERSEHVFLDADDVVLCLVCKAAQLETLFAGIHQFCLGFDVQADAGNHAFCFVAS